MDVFAPIRGTCVFWREIPNCEDTHNGQVPALLKRVDCQCFVEGHQWRKTNGTLPRDCPDCRKCRYYIKAS